jgi:hypothetical protein
MVIGSLFSRTKEKSAILTDLFSPTVEFLSQPRAFASVGPWLPGDQPILPPAIRKLGNLRHLRWEDGSKELCALNLTENDFFFSPFNRKGTECRWKEWQTIRLTPFCVCGELDAGDSLLHDAVSEKARKTLAKKQDRSEIYFRTYPLLRTHISTATIIASLHHATAQ